MITVEEENEVDEVEIGLHGGYNTSKDLSSSVDRPLANNTSLSRSAEHFIVNVVPLTRKIEPASQSRELLEDVDYLKRPENKQNLFKS